MQRRDLPFLEGFLARLTIYEFRLYHIGFLLEQTKKVGLKIIRRNFSQSPKIIIENKGFKKFGWI